MTGLDRLICPFTRDGFFTVKSTYKLLAGDLPVVSSNPQVNPIYKSLWKAPLFPKTQLFLWKYIEGILPTKNRLYVFRLNQDNTCNICDLNTSETVENLILLALFRNMFGLLCLLVILCFKTLLPLSIYMIGLVNISLPIQTFVVLFYLLLGVYGEINAFISSNINLLIH